MVGLGDPHCPVPSPRLPRILAGRLEIARLQGVHVSVERPALQAQTRPGRDNSFDCVGIDLEPVHQT